MFAPVVTPDHCRTRQNRWASPNVFHSDSTTLPNNHFYSPNDSDEDSTGGGFLPDQTHFTDQSLPFLALQQISNLSPVSDRPHLPSDDSWLATASDEFIEDTPYIPPTDHSTHYPSNITLPDPLRPPLDTPRDSRDIYSDSHFYDQPQDTSIAYSPQTSEYSHSSTSRRSSATHGSRDSGSHSSGESEDQVSGPAYEPPPSYSQPLTSTGGSQQQSFNPSLYPAYDQNNLNQRIGLEHIRVDAMEHVPTGRSYYREQTHAYGVRVSPPQTDHQSHEVAATHSATSQPVQVPNASQPRQQPLPPQPSNQPPAVRQSRQAFTFQVPVEEIPDPEPNLRQMLGIGPDQEISLDVLEDPPPGEKPNYPYPTLAKLAIHGSERKKLTLQEIYTALEDRFEWFKVRSTSETAWKRSIRHLLSLNKTFRKIARPVTDPGKGSYWIVDYSQGEGNKRVRKRNKKPTKAQLARQAAEAEKARQAERTGTAGSIPGPSHRSRSDSEGSHSSRRSVSGSFDESAIDPALSTQGHRVGVQRAALRTRARANKPYGNRMQSSEDSRSPESHDMNTSTVSNISGIMGGHQLIINPSKRPSVPIQNQPAFGRSSFGAQAPAVVPVPALSAFRVPSNSSSVSASQFPSPMTSTITESSSVAGRGFSMYQNSTDSLMQGRPLPAPVRGGRAAAKARNSSARVQNSGATSPASRNMSDSSGNEEHYEDRTLNSAYQSRN